MDALTTLGVLIVVFRSQRDCGLDIHHSNLGAGRGIRPPSRPARLHAKGRKGRQPRWTTGIKKDAKAARSSPTG